MTSSVIVKQSCTSARSMSSGPMPAMVNAWPAASTVAGKDVKLRFQLLISGSVASPVPRR